MQCAPITIMALLSCVLFGAYIKLWHDCLTLQHVLQLIVMLYMISQAKKTTKGKDVTKKLELRVSVLQLHSSASQMFFN